MIETEEAHPPGTRRTGLELPSGELTGIAQAEVTSPTRLPATPREWAIEYAVGGALVLPLHTPVPAGCSCRRRDCEHPGKHPRVMRGKDDATTDLEVIERWWRMWPDSNIGIRPNPGHVVLDVDPRNGGGDQFDAMQRRYGVLPATRTARTGSGGGHLWFSYPGPVRGKLAEGLDVKTHSGYLVVPPSVHACGGLYEWTNGGPIAPAPAYLGGLLAPPAPPSRPVAGQASPAVAAGLLRFVGEAKEGERNHRLYWACCRAVERGLDLNPLVDAAVANGLTRRSAEATAASAVNAPPRAPAGA